MANIPILILQLCDAEPGTLIDHELEKQRIPFERIRVFENTRIPDQDSIRAAIILGSPTSVNDFQQYDWAKTLYAWTSGAIRSNTPLLGICYGSQLLAKIFGATVSRHTEMELGIYDAVLTEYGATDPLFAGFGSSFSVAQWHGETWKLPYGATLLCEGEGCRNQAFRHGNILGLQFHLEGGLQEMSSWSEMYPQDVAISGKDANAIRADFQKRSEELQALFSKMIENWVKGV